MVHVEFTAENRSWDEAPYHEAGGVKLTRATVVQALAGGAEGEMTTEFLMCYAADGTAAYVGLARIDGAIGGRRGSFVAQMDGRYDGNEARSTYTVVPGSGTDGLVGLSGRGEARAPHGSQAFMTLEYEVG